MTARVGCLFWVEYFLNVSMYIYVMKHYFLLVFFLMLFVTKSTAQQTSAVQSILNKVQEEPALPTKEVINHIGGDVYIKDTIADCKIISKSLRLLYIGNRCPNHIITVIIKGEKVNKELHSWTKGVSNFAGKAIMYKGKPAIIITNALQAMTRVQI